jgi:hypothetical protein
MFARKQNGKYNSVYASVPELYERTRKMNRRARRAYGKVLMANAHTPESTKRNWLIMWKTDKKYFWGGEGRKSAKRGYVVDARTGTTYRKGKRRRSLKVYHVKGSGTKRSQSGVVYADSDFLGMM